MRAAAFFLVVLALSNAGTFYVTTKNMRPKRHTVESVVQSLGGAKGVVIMATAL